MSGKGRGASGPRPEDGIVNTVSTKTNAPRDLQTEAFEARGFNPLSTFGLRRAEELASSVRTAWAISAHACCASCGRRQRAFPAVPVRLQRVRPPQGPIRSTRPCRAFDDSRRTLPARPPLTAATVAVRAPFPCCQVRSVSIRFWSRGYASARNLQVIDIAVFYSLNAEDGA